VWLNMFIDDRACEMLFFGEDILAMDRERDRISWVFLVCDAALLGIEGASSPETFALEGAPK